MIKRMQETQLKNSQLLFHNTVFSVILHTSFATSIPRLRHPENEVIAIYVHYTYLSEF